MGSLFGKKPKQQAAPVQKSTPAPAPKPAETKTRGAVAGQLTRGSLLGVTEDQQANPRRNQVLQ